MALGKLGHFAARQQGHQRGSCCGSCYVLPTPTPHMAQDTLILPVTGVELRGDIPMAPKQGFGLATILSIEDERRGQWPGSSLPLRCPAGTFPMARTAASLPGGPPAIGPPEHRRAGRCLSASGGAGVPGQRREWSTACGPWGCSGRCRRGRCGARRKITCFIPGRNRSTRLPSTDVITGTARKARILSSRSAATWGTTSRACSRSSAS